MRAEQHIESTRGRGKLPPLSLAVPLVAALWALLFEARRFIDLVGTKSALTDFRRIYVAAEVGLRVGWSRIYDVGPLRDLNLPLAPQVGSDPLSVFYMNPPIVAWLVVPLTLLPLSAALVVWSAVNVGSLVAASRLVFPQGGSLWIATLLVSLALWPAAFSLERGQMEPIVYSLVIVSWWMAERGRERWAGVFLALALAFKPQDVYLLPVIFLICGRFRAAVWWLAASTALLAIFALAVGAEGFGADFAAIWWSSKVDPSFIASPVLTPFGPDLSLLVGQGLFGLLALGAAWRQRHSLRIAFAIGLVGTLASGVHLHVYDYVGLEVAAWLVISRARLTLPELGWLGLGVVCAQLTAIGLGWPLLLWQVIWLVLLGIQPRAQRSVPRSAPELQGARV